MHFCPEFPDHIRFGVKYLDFQEVGEILSIAAGRGDVNSNFAIYNFMIYVDYNKNVHVDESFSEH